MDTPVTPLPQPEKPARSYTATDTLLAVLIPFLAYAWLRSGTASHAPFSHLLLALCLFGISFWYLKKHQLPLLRDRYMGWLLAAVLLLNIALLFNSNAFLQNLIETYTLLAYCYWLFAATGNAAEPRPASLFCFDLLKAVFLPITSLACEWEALGRAKGSRKVGRTLLLVCCGIAVALVPTVIVLLLLAYDNQFTELLTSLFRFSPRAFGDRFAAIVGAIPVTMFLFGALYAGRHRLYASVLTADDCHRIAGQVKVAPVLLVCSALTPILFLYAVFFCSQYPQYLAAFRGLTPDGMAYAAYARNGFFELCTVSTLNALFLLLSSVLCRPSAKVPTKKPTALVVYHSLLSVFTLILIATAMSKLVLYIRIYGLTPKRVLAAWFMLFLTVCFLLVLVKQIRPRLNLTFWLLVCLTVLLLALVLCNLDGVIASYQVNRVLDGTLTDLTVLHDLGDSAVPALDRLARRSSDPALREVAIRSLMTYAEEQPATPPFWSFTIPQARAASILRAYR